MKHRLFTLAAALALFAVLGKFYAVPALAEAVKMTVVQDRDSRGRNYFQVTNLSCGYSVGLCSLDLPTVPAGKRLIITQVSGEALTAGANDLWRVSLWSKGQWPSAFLPFSAPVPTSNNMFDRSFHQEIWAAFEATQTPQLVVQSTGASGFAWQAMVSGYWVDLP